MKTLLSRFTVDDVRKANAKLVKSGRSESSEIKLTANGKTKIISTRVNAEQINEAWAKVVKK